jgi:AraC family transcriptional regulator of arabinose operon
MDHRVAKAINLMREAMTDQVSIQGLSRAVNLSPGRLREVFRRETGRSPIQYLRDLRLRRAEQLLRTTCLTIKEVAFSSGAKDFSHFVRDFKKKYGLSPRAFRARVN